MMASEITERVFSEDDRQQLVSEFAAEHGTDWLEKYKPGSHGCHELLDRTNLLSNMVEQHVLQHPACAQNPEWFALADQAVAALCELYQRVGAEHV